MFYIISKDGKPLMPTSRYRHIKQLIKEGKAKKISSKPFIVQLLYETEDKTQPLICGVDPGRTNIGLSVITEDGKPVFEAQLITRNREIPKLMRERKANRRKHRSYGRRKRRFRRAVKNGSTTKKTCAEQKQVNTTVSVGVIERILPSYEKPVKCIGIKNKKARFSNRKHRRLTPTANQLLQTHVNAVKKLQKFLPITQIVLEVNKFAFMELDNPDVQKWQYAKGPLYQKNGPANAVAEQQGGHCMFCEGPIDHLHHIIPVSKGGSDRLPNRAGLCEHHHQLVHTDDKWRKEMADKKDGLNKKYGALSVLNQIIPQLTKEYARIAETKVTSGRSTFQFRNEYGIEKSHSADAYCIACSALKSIKIVVTDHEDRFTMLQFRRHDRKACNQEMLNRKYLLDGKVVATNRHRATEQKTVALDEYVATGGRTDNLVVKEHHATYRRFDRIMPGAMFLVDGQAKTMCSSSGLHNGRPDYYHFADGSKASPTKCKLLKLNSGIVF